MIKTTYDLEIDPQFKFLTLPISAFAYSQLEESLVDNGCMDPIIIWNNFILDGHKRYEICRHYEIPFSVVNTDFICRESAVAWICANHLRNSDDLIDETRKYLIGREHEAIMSLTPVQRKLQSESTFFFIPYSTGQGKIPTAAEYRNLTCGWVAKNNNVSRATVQKYTAYAKAIDKIASKVPDIIPSILTGIYKISHNNVIELSRMTPEGIQKVRRRIEALQRDPYVQYKSTRAEIHKSNPTGTCEESSISHSVKDMPEFDPDAEVVGLTLTVPSWSSSIERVRTKSDLSNVSTQARQRLYHALHNHMQCITDMLSAIKED